MSFEDKAVRGRAVHAVTVLVDGLSQLVLDTSGLTVRCGPLLPPSGRLLISPGAVVPTLAILLLP